jgi:non-ribosomal peptide synthetase component E (peptide arylation enzyme)
MSKPRSARRDREAARRAVADAVVVEDAIVALTGAALETRSRPRRALRIHGIRPGDRVVVINENSVSLAVLVFALSRIGAWPVLVNARLSAAEIDSDRGTLPAHAPSPAPRQPRRRRANMPGGLEPKRASWRMSARSA